MSRVVIQASSGALWVADRIPNKVFPQFQEELEQAMLAVLENTGTTLKFVRPSTKSCLWW
ncbi:hypothetical protein [Salmonella phage SKML-39]|uniref:Uncharacterized protein n=1 Tax=Salmonella phage SKML-39 TaxID=1204528 RepID=K4IGA7_9CAUD|nr:hypothetical protein G178_gp086 [Salmonella phage SKML-39]AFU64429.1 hypothetical protein [Salmonella phage SKML-39]